MYLLNKSLLQPIAIEFKSSSRSLVLFLDKGLKFVCWVTVACCKCCIGQTYKIFSQMFLTHTHIRVTTLTTTVQHLCHHLTHQSPGFTPPSMTKLQTFNICQVQSHRKTNIENMTKMVRLVVQSLCK